MRWLPAPPSGTSGTRFPNAGLSGRGLFCKVGGCFWGQLNCLDKLNTYFDGDNKYNHTGAVKGKGDCSTGEGWEGAAVPHYGLGSLLPLYREPHCMGVWFGPLCLPEGYLLVTSFYVKSRNSEEMAVV